MTSFYSLVFPILNPNLELLARSVSSFHRSIIIHNNHFPNSDVKFELVIVDSTSPPIPKSFFLQYACMLLHVRLIQCEPNGIYNAISAGIKSSTSSHFIFLNHDDYLLPNGFIKALRFSLDFPDSLILSNSYIISSDNTLAPFSSRFHRLFLRLTLLLGLYPVMPANHGAIIYPRKPIDLFPFQNYSLFDDFTQLIQILSMRTPYYFLPNNFSHVFSLEGTTGKLSPAERKKLDLLSIVSGFSNHMSFRFLFSLFLRIFVYR